MNGMPDGSLKTNRCRWNLQDVTVRFFQLTVFVAGPNVDRLNSLLLSNFNRLSQFRPTDNRLKKMPFVND